MTMLLTLAIAIGDVSQMSLRLSVTLNHSCRHAIYIQNYIDCINFFTKWLYNLVIVYNSCFLIYNNESY